MDATARCALQMGIYTPPEHERPESSGILTRLLITNYELIITNYVETNKTMVNKLLQIYPASGNPAIAAMIMTIALYTTPEPGAGVQVDSLTFSFSSQETANEFSDSIQLIAGGGTNNSSTVKIFPAYAIGYNAFQAMIRAIHTYGHSLTGIHELNFYFFSQEETETFLEHINKAINNYSDSEAFTFKIS